MSGVPSASRHTRTVRSWPPRANEPGASAPMLEEARDHWQQLGDACGSLFATATLGALALSEGDLPRARPLVHSCLDIARGTGAPYSIGYACETLGMLVLAERDMAEAARCFGISLRNAHAVGDPFITSYSLVGLAAVASSQDDLERAARLFGAAERLRAIIDSPVLTEQQGAKIADADAVRLGLGDDRFTAAATTGRTLPLPDIITTDAAMVTDLPAAHGLTAFSGLDAAPRPLR
jgi:MalT-like TPR region